MFGEAQSPLVDRLVAAEQQIEVCTRSEVGAKRADLLRAIGYDLINVKFVETEGGTDLGINVVREACADLDLPVDPADGPKMLRLVGELTLDFVPIRVTATFSRDTFTGVAIVEQRERANAA